MHNTLLCSLTFFFSFFFFFNDTATTEIYTLSLHDALPISIFIAIMVIAVFLLWRGKLFSSRWMLWILLLALPFPYIANTAGWMTAELGRQPWLVYALMRTADGYSKTVSAGNGIFTLLGFMGMYTVLGILFLFLVRREVENGPEVESVPGH